MKNPYHRLRNHLDKQQALEVLAQENFNRVVVSFYRYVRITDPVNLRHELFSEWQNLGVLGRVYLAEEGINAQISIPEPSFETFKEKYKDFVLMTELEREALANALIEELKEEIKKA